MDRTKKQLVLPPAGTFLMNIYLMASVHTACRVTITYVKDRRFNVAAS
jgi:hypothetical protein